MSEPRNDRLTMAELAARLELPESTLRYYCKTFADYLPYTGSGRRRRYAPEAEEILRFIAKAMRKNKNATAVALMLASGQGRRIIGGEVPPPSGPSPAAEELLDILRRQVSALGEIALGLASLTEQLKASPPVAAGPSESAGLKELEDLRQQVSTSEQMHQEDLEQLRKWLGRLNEAVARLG